MLTRAALRLPSRRALPFVALVFMGAVYFASLFLGAFYLAPPTPFSHERRKVLTHPSSAPALARLLGAHVARSIPVQYKEFRFNGFGSRFLRVLDAAAVADATGAPFEILEEGYWNYACAPERGWSCYFERRPAPLRNCTPLERLSGAAAAPPLRCIRIGSVAAMHRAAALMAGVSAGALGPSHRLAIRLWRLNAPTRAAVGDILTQAGLKELRGAYVGVHVRRGDKWKEVQDVPLGVYAAAVRCVAGDLPVVLATDDGTVVESCARCFRSGTCWSSLTQPRAPATNRRP